MKKKIIFLLLILVFPLVIKGQEVNKIFITGTDTASIGKEVSLTFNVTLNGIDKNSNDSYGVGGYTYQLDFDDEILVPVGINKSDFFNTKIYKDENNKYHVIGSINKDNKSKNKCSDNILYCGDVKDTIVFVAKQTTETMTTVKVFGASIYFYKVGSELNDKDKIIVDSIQNVSKNLKIEKNKSKELSIKNIAIYINSSGIEKEVQTELQEYKDINDEKGNNNLKILEIEDYEITFGKHMLSYDINIDNDVNSLKINAETESEKAKVEIIGNDDLKKNNYIVEIIVTAENGEKKIYKINALTEKKEEVKEEIETNEDIKNFFNKIKSKFKGDTLRIIEIVGASLFGLVLIILIIKLIINKKLDKKLKDFDKF